MGDHTKSRHELIEEIVHLRARCNTLEADSMFKKAKNAIIGKSSDEKAEGILQDLGKELNDHGAIYVKHVNNKNSHGYPVVEFEANFQGRTGDSVQRPAKAVSDGKIITGFFTDAEGGTWNSESINGFISILRDQYHMEPHPTKQGGGMVHKIENAGHNAIDRIKHMNPFGNKHKGVSSRELMVYSNRILSHM